MSILNHPPNPHIPYEHSVYGQKLIQHINQRPEMDNLSNKELADQIQALRIDMESRYRENQMREGWSSSNSFNDLKVKPGKKSTLDEFYAEGLMAQNAEAKRANQPPPPPRNQSNNKDDDTVPYLFIAGGVIGWIFLIKEIFN